MKIIKYQGVVQMVRETVTKRERARRLWGWALWHLRPQFLKDAGQPVRLRWWVCFQLMKRLDKRIRTDLALGRQAMFDNFDAGRSSPAFMRGKRAAERARLLEARMLWLAYEGGAQYFDGDSRISLLEFAGMDILRNPRKAR